MIRAGVSAGHNQLIPGGDQRHRWFPAHGYLGDIHRRKQGNVCRRQDTRRINGGANLEITAFCANIMAGSGMICDSQQRSGNAGIFLNNNEISAIRHWRSGEDPHRLTGSDTPLKPMAGSAFSDDFEHRIPLYLCRFHCVAVHGGGGKGGLVAVGGHRLRKHATGSGAQGNGLHFKRCHQIKQRVQCVGN